VHACETTREISIIDLLTNLVGGGTGAFVIAYISKSWFQERLSQLIRVESERELASYKAELEHRYKNMTTEIESKITALETARGPALTHESEETDWMGHAAGRLKKTFAKKG